MIDVYIANLGKYNEGEILGGWISLPCDNSDIDKLMAEIGLGVIDKDGNYTHGYTEIDENGYAYCYEEYSIDDYCCEIDDLDIGSYSSPYELNKIATALSELKEHELEEVKALLELGYIKINSKNVDDIKNVLERHIFGSYDNSMYNSDLALGYALAEMDGVEYELDKLNLTMYFDYESYGRDARFNGVGLASNGIFVI